MLIVTHFAIPFYSYYLTDRFLKKYKDKKELFLYSCVIGLAGLTPDIFRAGDCPFVRDARGVFCADTETIPFLDTIWGDNTPSFGCNIRRNKVISWW